MLAVGLVLRRTIEIKGGVTEIDRACKRLALF
jgi:hypothetical protein